MDFNLHFYMVLTWENQFGADYYFFTKGILRNYLKDHIFENKHI